MDVVVISSGRVGGQESQDSSAVRRARWLNGGAYTTESGDHVVTRRKTLSRRQQTRRRRAKGRASLTRQQQALHHALQDPIVQPTLTPEQERDRLRELVQTLTRQRDDALGQLNDRANIAIAVERFGEQVERLRGQGERLIQIGTMLRRAIRSADWKV